ncbi:MAG: hypothetical protein ACTSXA_06655 [Candidatus Heimdallarchaeota archaeon]
MSKKKIILMSNIFLLLIFICSSFTSANAATREWKPGDFYRFGNRVQVRNVVADLDSGNAGSTEMYFEEEITFNVTAIDLLSGTYTARYIDSGGASVQVNNFLMDTFVNSYISTFDVFTIQYGYDQEHNRTLITGFDAVFQAWLLIEPDWPVLMQAMLDTLNETEIVDQVADPYDPILYNFTFGQFLSDITSYSLNGKDTIAQAKSKAIKDDTTSYEFIFDLSGLIYTGSFNATLGYDIYTPFDKYVISAVMEYTEVGVLNYYQYKLDYEISIDNMKIGYCVNVDTVLGGLESFDANFSYLVAIPAIITVAVGLRIAQKRRRKR